VDALRAAGPGVSKEGGLFMCPAGVGTSPYTSGPRVWLRCADVHDVACDASWTSSNPDDLVYLAQCHGPISHGIARGWYSPERLAIIRAAVTG
jgi:hypothetical protein